MVTSLRKFKTGIATTMKMGVMMKCQIDTGAEIVIIVIIYCVVDLIMAW